MKSILEWRLGASEMGNNPLVLSCRWICIKTALSNSVGQVCHRIWVAQLEEVEPHTIFYITKIK